MMSVQYIGLLPSLIAVSYAMNAVADELPLWLKLILETLILVPFLNYAITPTVDKIFEDWLYAGIDDRRSSRA